MERILIVEDDSGIVLGLKYSLEQEGFRVDAVGTIKAAKQNFDNNKYDLIIVDVNLPDGDGYSFCKVIREKSDVGVLFLTACDEEVNIVMGLDLGADDYITKPFRVRELISRIKAILRRKGKKSTDERKILKFSNLRVHSLEGKVYKNDEELVLTALEYKLLMLFIQNPNNILSRNHILDRLWDVSGEFVNDNTLTVYIKRLRSKIEDDISNPKFIVTIRGMGYRWQGTGCDNI